MQKRTKIFMGILIGILILTGVGFLIKKNEKKSPYDAEVVIKENVHTSNAETEKKYKLSKITDSALVYEKDPKYKKGDIIASGMTDNAPNGFLRKISRKRVEEGKYIYETENAVLTEVYEKAHISRRFIISDRDAAELNDKNETVASLSQPNDIKVVSGDGKAEPEIVKLGKADLNLHEISLKANKKLNKVIDIDADITLKNILEITLDIEDGRVDFGMVNKEIVKGGMSVGAEKSWELEEPLTYTFVKKRLPNIEFTAGIPIVVTSDFMADAKVSGKLTGALKTGVDLDSEKTYGFKYSAHINKAGKYTELKRENYNGKGVTWETGLKAQTECDAGVYMHIVSKLYDSAGMDLSVGMNNVLEGEVFAGKTVKRDSKEKTPLYYGKMEYTLVPKIGGNVVLTEPIIDKKIFEQTLFEGELDPLVKKTWEEVPPHNEDKIYKEFLKNSDAEEYAIEDINLDGENELFTCTVTEGVKNISLYYCNEDNKVVKVKSDTGEDLFLAEGVASAGGFRGSISLIASGGIQEVYWQSGNGEGRVSKLTYKDGKISPEVIKEGLIITGNDEEDPIPGEKNDVPWELNIRPIEEIEKSLLAEKKKEGKEIYRGTIHCITGAKEMLKFQNIEDKPYIDGGNTEERYVILDFAQPQDVQGMAGDGMGMRTEKSQMLLLKSENYMDDRYDGREVYVTTVKEKTWFPSDVRLPLGEPSLEEWEFIR